MNQDNTQVNKRGEKGNTFTIRLNPIQSQEFDKVKSIIREKTATKAFLILLAFPERYNQQTKDLKEAKARIKELEKIISNFQNSLNVVLNTNL